MKDRKLYIIAAAILVGVIAFVLFVYPGPQLKKYFQDVRSAEIADSIVDSLENPLEIQTEAPVVTDEPAEVSTEEPTVTLQALPTNVSVEKMLTCGESGVDGKWDERKAPFAGTELVCGDDKFWNITRLFYNGDEYQVPKLENVNPNLPYWIASTTTVDSAGTEVQMTLIVPNGLACSRDGKNLPNGYEQTVKVMVSEDYGSADCIRESDNVQVSAAKVFIAVVEGESSFSQTSESAALTSDEYSVPGTFIRLPDQNGVTYSITTAGPFTVEYVYGQTVFVAAGNMTIDGTKIYETDKKGTVGNIHADVCLETEGCSFVLTGYKPGHIRVTIIDGGTEVPAEAVASALDGMLTGLNNCGNKCLFVYLGYGTSDQKYKFDKHPVDATSIDLVEPSAPYPVAIPKAEGVPSGAMVIYDSNDVPVGDAYYLSAEKSFINVPETGGTIVLCGAPCNIVGRGDFEGNTAILFAGFTDGKTPKDLNKTLEVVVKSNPAMVLVYVFYADFENQRKIIEEKYKDWLWP